MQLVTEAHADDAARDMALSETMLTAVARRSGPETLRIYRPGPTVAFGRVDQRRRARRAGGRVLRRSLQPPSPERTEVAGAEAVAGRLRDAARERYVVI